MLNKTLAARKLLLLTLFVILLVGCGESKKKSSSETEETFFKLSLAQWSFHDAILKGDMSPYDFAKKANELGFEGLEYVSYLYHEDLKKIEDEATAMQHFVEKSLEQSKKYGLRNLLIMIDGEGNLAITDDEEIKQTVEKHKKWVDAAAALGCHSVRVNLSGSTEPEVWQEGAVKGLTALATYAATKKINVIVENHGGLSSNGALLATVISKVNMKNCGTLPDFGNFCLKKESGEQWGDSPCVEEYDRYKGIEELMPYAKAVSAKSYDFDEQGNETLMDYKKILSIVKKSGYRGFIGVEYEGTRLSEQEGTIATKELLLNVANEL